MFGARLRQSRLAAGMTLDSLVDRLQELGVEVTKQALSNYEADKRTPRPAILMGLSRSLGVKPAQLFSEPSASITWLRYRKRRKLTKTAQDEIEALAATSAEKWYSLHSLLFGEVKPEFPTRRKVKTMAQAEEAAGELRQAWKLGEDSIESVARTVEDHGGIVVSLGDTYEFFDGLSGWINNAFPLIVTATVGAVDRLRFNIAHELGHLVMDTNDLDSQSEETLAHCFAGAFLAPATAIRAELGTVRRNVHPMEFGLVKEKYGLSMQACMYRALALGIISESHFKSLTIKFRSRGWHKNEPVSFHADESPLRLRQMALRALAEDIITYDEAKELVPDIPMPEKKGTPARVTPSAKELLSMPREIRLRMLSDVVQHAQSIYADNPELTEWADADAEDVHEHR